VQSRDVPLGAESEIEPLGQREGHALRGPELEDSHLLPRSVRPDVFDPIAPIDWLPSIVVSRSVFPGIALSQRPTVRSTVPILSVPDLMTF